MVRPLKEAAAGTVVTIGMRVPAELKTAIEAEAAKHDRNLSQECERRLRRSLDVEALLADAFDRIRAEKGLWSLEAAATSSSVMQLALREVYGGDIGGSGVRYLDWLQWARQPARRARGREGLDAIKGEVREIEAAQRDNDLAVAKLSKREKR